MMPDDFWHQTPLHFQYVMKGVRKRLEAQNEANTALAWQSAAFTGAASVGKLKPLREYLRKPPRKMSNAEMLANMRILAMRNNRKFGKET